MKENTLKELKGLLKLSDEKILKEHLSEMQRLYSLFFEGACQGCSSKQKTYLNQLRKMLEKVLSGTSKKEAKEKVLKKFSQKELEEKEKVLSSTSKKEAKEKEKRSFRLKKGFLIRFATLMDSYSDANLTDEALSYLKLNPACIYAFEKYPLNWEKLIGDKFVK